MVDVAHASLTASNLHEPKGVATAASGTVYIADGAGSGTWSSVSSVVGVPAGAIQDFATPVAPTGWLECNGATIDAAAYPALFAALTVQRSGTRINGSAVITGLASTAGYAVGYYVAGNGISGGSQIIGIGANQITISVTALSSGTDTVYVSPWPLNSSQIVLPDLTTQGRYRRSRSGTFTLGGSHDSANLAHTHTWSLTSCSDPGDHTHTISITDPGHSHTTGTGGNSGLAANIGSIGSGTVQYVNNGTLSTNSNTTGITASASSTGAHTHAISGSNTSDGLGEARVTTVIFMTCIKT